MKKRQGKTMNLAKDYFCALEEVNRLEDMLSERIVDLVGGTESCYVDFNVTDCAVIIQCAPNSLAVREDGQKTIYALGFKRIWIHHQNGMETDYYEGGPVSGKTFWPGQ